MADPQTYRVTYSFGGYQASNPARPLPAPQVDNEFSNIEKAIGQLVDAVKNVRRSDGKLQNGLVTFDSLAKEIRLLFDDGAVENATLLANAVASASASAASAQINADAAAAASGLDPALVLAGAALDSETVLTAASTTNIGGTATTRVRIDGTDNIVSLGVVSKRLRIVRYNGAFQIAHNSVSQILIGGASRPVAVGDQSLFMSDADGNWRELLYVKADGSPLAIVDHSITYAKLQNASGTGLVLGRKTAGSGTFEECSLTDILDMVTGTAQGDVLFRGSSAWKRLGAGAAGQYIKSNGPSADLSYQTLFGQIVHVREEQNSGVGSATGNGFNTWVTRVLNAVKANDIMGASLSSNQVTLPAGTYDVDATMTYGLHSGGGPSTLKFRLFDTTSNVVLAASGSLYFNIVGPASAIQAPAPMKGRFTLAAPATIALQHYSSVGDIASAMGQGVEVYSDLVLKRVA